jgi:hypothetical protein
MTGSGFEARFETLRGEMLGFLAGRSAAAPDRQAQTIDAVAAEIESARLPATPQAARRLPGCRHLETALAMAKGGPMESLTQAFAALEPDLRWIRTEHYREKLGDAYMENYCYTNVLGYEGLIEHDRVIATFFIIGPGRHYPRHHHEAEEIYFPFGGDTLWSQNDEPPRERPAGEAVHNTPWLPHAMTTRETPLFTFCFWRSPGPIKLAQLTD